MFFQQLGTGSPLGTLAYIIQEQSLLIRVNNGWQYVGVSLEDKYPLNTIFTSQINPQNARPTNLM